MTFRTFEEFWPYYVEQHRDARCRALHVTGLTLALLCAPLAAFISAWWIVGGFAIGYGLSWTGHFVFEKNKPATFGHVLWSLRADLRMYRYLLLRRDLSERRSL